MPNPASIRLGTTGKAQVKADFAEVAESGTASFTKVGDAAAAQSRRWVREEENALRDLEAARTRLEKSRAKQSLLAPGLNPGKLDAFAGVNDNIGRSAASSAEVFEAAYRKMEQRAAALVAAIDPVFAAQQRFDREMAQAKTLLDAGALSSERYAQVERQLLGELNAVSVANARGVNSTGALRAAMQGASYQVQDTFTQLSMGANVMQVVAIQGGQLAGQFANIEGKAGAVARFMIGPCATASTPASIARTERPKLPKLSAELTQAERLEPIAAKPTGELVTIDRGILADITTAAAAAIGAVERLNTRIGGLLRERACTAAILAAGTAPANCPQP